MGVNLFQDETATLNPQPSTLNFFYTRDHLGSIRELTDVSGTVRARYAYDPYGRRTKLMGDMETDFSFAGMFWSAEANLFLTHFRAYDPELGRWLSRDPLPGAEIAEGPNLYAYVINDPVNLTDPEGLSSANLKLAKLCAASVTACREVLKAMGKVAVGGGTIGTVAQGVRRNAPAVQGAVNRGAQCAYNMSLAEERITTLGNQFNALFQPVITLGGRTMSAWDFWRRYPGFSGGQMPSLLKDFENRFVALKDMLMRTGMSEIDAINLLITRLGWFPDYIKNAWETGARAILYGGKVYF